MKTPALSLCKSSAILALVVLLAGLFNPLTARGQTVLVATNTTISGGTIGYDGKSLVVSNCILTVTGGVHPFNSVLLTNSPSLALEGGSIQGAIITSADGASLVVSSGTLDGVTVNGVLDVGNSYAADLTVVGGLVLNGTALVGNTNYPFGGISFAGSQILSGNGTVVFGGDSFNVLRLANAGTTLTIGGGITVRGQNGTIGYSADYGGPVNVGVIIQGKISADVAGGTIVINAQPLSNAGTLSATIGALNMSGAYNLAGGALNVGIGGLSSFGNITFPTVASLGGTFTVSKLDGYLPNPGNTFQVLKFPSSTNSFTCLGGLDLGGGILLQPQFSRTGLTLRAAAYSTSASQPQLFINRTLGGMAITWPAAFPGWALRSTTNLPSPAWTTVASPCGNQAVVPITAQPQYFRLDHP